MDTTNQIEKREAAMTEAERLQCGRCYVPAVDIVENGEELLLIADVPGAKADDIDIDIERGELTINARVRQRQDQKNANHLLREYGVGDFSRTFRVGDAVDSGKIRAEVADGVLTLHLPKAEALRPRKIAVKNAN